MITERGYQFYEQRRREAMSEPDVERDRKDPIQPLARQIVEEFTSQYPGADGIDVTYYVGKYEVNIDIDRRIY